MHEPIAPSSILGRAEPLEAVGRTDYQARHGGGSMSAWAGVRAGLNLIRIAVIIILVAFVLLSGLLLFVPAALREAGAKAEVEQAVVGWLLAVAVWTLVAAALMYLIGLCRCLTAPPSSRVPDMVWAILGCHALGFLLSLGSRLVELSPYSVNWGANCLVLVSLAFVVVSGIMFVALLREIARLFGNAALIRSCKFFLLFSFVGIAVLPALVILLRMFLWCSQMPVDKIEQAVSLAARVLGFSYVVILLAWLLHMLAQTRMAIAAAPRGGRTR